MPSESGDRRATAPATARAGNGTVLPPPAEAEHLPCPRCDSTNTKFCYYNNYNFSQPRHFCKACRRYWTHGGTLRDIPVGGGTRRSAKRPRCSNNHHNNNNSITPSAAAASSTPSSSSAAAVHSVSAAASTAPTAAAVVSGGMTGPMMDPVFVSMSTAAMGGDVGVKPQPAFVGGVPAGSFTSLLNASGGPPGGFLALGGLGLGMGIGLGQGFEDGAGYGRGGMWAFPEIGYLDGGGCVVGAGGMSVGGANGGVNAWQLENGSGDHQGGGGGGGFVGSDCFSWPELAISTPGSCLK